jgi:hypothetical protein
MSDFNQGRNARGRFTAGNPANPGGLSRRQRTVLKIVENLTVKAARVLEETLDGPDPKLRFEAAREVIRRCTPNANRSPASVNVAVQNVISDGARENAVAVAQLRQLYTAGRISLEEFQGMTGRKALAAPVIDVTPEPADELDRLAETALGDEDEDDEDDNPI